jgi:hypothetical protein
MYKKYEKKYMCSSILLALSFLPGCTLLDSFKNSSPNSTATTDTSTQVSNNNNTNLMTGDIVATMNGKPLISSTILEVEKENIMKSKPEYRAALAFMDTKVLDRNLTEGLISQAVVDQYIVEQGIDSSAEYQSELADIIKNMKRILNAKFFSQKFNVTVSDAEISKFYESNKNAIPDLIISQGGVVALGMQFDNEISAKEFMIQVKNAQNDLKKAAQDAGVSNAVKDFKMVNSQSIGIDPALRDKIVALKTVPSVEMMTVNGAVWVISATAKETAKYRPLEQVKDGIKQLLENNKRAELVEAEITKLRDKYNVSINEEYFKSDAGAAPDMEESEEDFDATETASKSAQADFDRENALSKRLA